jgi:hypothetical protein
MSEIIDVKAVDSEKAESLKTVGWTWLWRWRR